MSDISPSPSFGKPINRLGVFTTIANSDNATSRKCMNLFADTDLFVSQIKVPKVSDLTFVVDGVPFHARNNPRGEVADLTIWCVLGYLPYSVVSQDKRMSLLAILEGSLGLKTVRFGVDGEMRIIATASFEIPNPPTPNYIFEPLITFMQNARPFMSLIGDYL